MGARRDLRPRATLVTALALITKREAVAEEVGGARSPDAVRQFTDWEPDDPVEVFYGELLLAQWVLDHAPWNAYHSGLGFVNNRTQEKVLFDYTPVNTSSVMNLLVPEVHIQSTWRAWLLGEASFVYHDEAKTQFYPHWPKSYTSFVRLGHLNGSLFYDFADWVAGEFAPSHQAFQPLEVATADNGTVGAFTAVRSRMCHDFVTDALWVLYRGGARLKAEDVIFRDHIIMYATAVDVATTLLKTRRGTRMRLRYLRLIALYLEDIKQQFTAARNVLVAAFRLGIPVFLHDEFKDYHVHLVPPFLNYCYLPLAIPPAVHNPLGSMKLCALGMEANLTNGSAPLPWGPLLAMEERLDRPGVLVSLLLVAATSVVVLGRAAGE